MKKVVSKFFEIIFMIIIIISVSEVIFIDNSIMYFCQKSRNFPNLLILLGLIIISSVVFIIKKGLKKESFFLNIINKFKKMVSILSTIKNIDIIRLVFVSGILFILQLVIVKRIYFMTGWDCGTILTNANTVGYGHTLLGLSEYYSEYPNNIVITAVLSIFYRMAHNNPYEAILTANCFVVNLSGIFMMLSLKKMTKNKYVFCFGYFVYIVLVALSPWIVIPYSDTFSCIYPILIFYIYLLTKDKKMLILKWLLIGIFAFFGMALKPTVIIMLMAIVIAEIIELVGDKKRIKNFGKMCLGIIVGYILLMPLQSICIKHLGLRLETNKEITITHFAMLGLNEERTGVYSDWDIAYTNSFPNVKERQKGNMQEIDRRLKDFGPIGYGSFLMKKNLVNLNDATFAWEIEGNFYAVKNTETSTLRILLKNIYYGEGKYHEIYKLIVQFFWICVLLLLVAFSFEHKGKEEIYALVIKLAILGIIIFLLIFEARARYLYLYLPVFIIGASLGLNFIIDKINAKANKDESISIEN